MKTLSLHYLSMKCTGYEHLSLTTNLQYSSHSCGAGICAVLPKNLSSHFKAGLQPLRDSSGWCN